MQRTFATYVQCLALAWTCALTPALAHASDGAPARTSLIPTPAQVAAAAFAQGVVDERGTAPERASDTSLFESPWFWAGVAGVVLAGVAVALVATRPDPEPAVPAGTLGVTVAVLTQDACASANERP